MGLFSSLKRSNDKSKEMLKVQKAYVSFFCDNDRSIDFDGYIRNYYKFISKDPVLKEYIEKYQLTEEDMVGYFNLFLANGFVEKKGYLIPLYTFSFAKPMDYFLTEIKKGTPMYMIGYTIQQMI